MALNELKLGQTVEVTLKGHRWPILGRITQIDRKFLVLDVPPEADESHIDTVGCEVRIRRDQIEVVE